MSSIALCSLIGQLPSGMATSMACLATSPLVYKLHVRAGAGAGLPGVISCLVPGAQLRPELGTAGRTLDIDTITLHTPYPRLHSTVGWRNQLETIHFLSPSYLPQPGAFILYLVKSST